MHLVFFCHFKYWVFFLIFFRGRLSMVFTQPRNSQLQVRRTRFWFQTYFLHKSLVLIHSGRDLLFKPTELIYGLGTDYLTITGAMVRGGSWLKPVNVLGGISIFKYRLKQLAWRISTFWEFTIHAWISKSPLDPWYPWSVRYVCYGWPWRWRLCQYRLFL